MFQLKGLKSPQSTIGMLYQNGSCASKEQKELPYTIEVLHLRAKSNSKTPDKYGQESKIN